MKPIIIPGYCDRCGGAMVTTAKGQECEACGNPTARKEN